MKKLLGDDVYLLNTRAHSSDAIQAKVYELYGLHVKYHHCEWQDYQNYLFGRINARTAAFL